MVEQHQSWPFWFVVFHMSLAGLVYPLRIFASENEVLRSASGLHMFTLSTMAMMWTFYFLTYSTDPGAIGFKTEEMKKVRGEYHGVGEKLACK